MDPPTFRPLGWTIISKGGIIAEVNAFFLAIEGGFLCVLPSIRACSQVLLGSVFKEPAGEWGERYSLHLSTLGAAEDKWASAPVSCLHEPFSWM
ncbi:uncharacterized protein LOC144306869 isoform X3 [Canis aureus]